MKYIIWVLFSYFCFIPFSFADDALVTGGIGSIINIVVVDDNQLKQEVADIRLQSTPEQGSRVARIYCDNNNFYGFSLTLVSDRVGNLVHFKNNIYVGEGKEGGFIPYQLDLKRGNTGDLGIDMPPEGERLGFTLDMPMVVYFNDNVLEATHDAEFFLNMHTVKKPSLFKGVFQDTITVTIADL